MGVFIVIEYRDLSSPAENNLPSRVFQKLEDCLIFYRHRAQKDLQIFL
jgi:hypothetical protein